MASQPEARQSPPNVLSPGAQWQHWSTLFSAAPLATFVYRVDDQRFQTALLRYAQIAGENKLYWRVVVGLLIAGAILMAACFGLLPDPFLNAAPVLFLLTIYFIFVVTLPLIRRKAALQNLKKSKAYNAVGTSSLHREGFFYQFPPIFVAIRWELFSRAARFTDGILLVGEGRTVWLPVADLTSGRIDDVEAILREKIADYKEMRP